MGIISPAVQSLCCFGRCVACCRRWGVGAPCRCRAILFSVAIVPLVYELCNPHRAHRAQREKISICVEQAGMSEVDIPVFYVSQVAGRYCVAVKKGDTKIVLFVNLIVQ